jgi:hypothetical protein
MKKIREKEKEKEQREKRVLMAVKKSYFNRRRKPEVVGYTILSKAFKYIPQCHLAREIAFVLSTIHSERLSRERYMLAYNLSAISNWEKIAVIQRSKEIVLYKDIVCVDFKEMESEEFRSDNRLFVLTVIQELKLLAKGVINERI